MEALKYRPLTDSEKSEIEKARALISFYRTGIMLQEMKINMIEYAPEKEYFKRLCAEPIEF